MTTLADVLRDLERATAVLLAPPPPIVTCIHRRKHAERLHCAWAFVVKKAEEEP